MAASIREIKQRMIATKKTSQITNAMNMVSASKLKQSQREINGFIPYTETIEDIIINLANSGEKLEHPLLTPREVKKTCYILITSDRGLAGSFNSNLCKLISKAIEGKDYVVATLGTKGYLYCKHKKINTIDKIIRMPDEIYFEDVYPLVNEIIHSYISGTIDEVVIVYNHFVNTLHIVPEFKIILPIQQEFTNEKHVNQLYDYEGGVDSILDAVLPLYVKNVVYGIILDSKTSEHASRMTAMKNATDNAKEVIQNLEIKYNRARQTAITLELTDIIGGANAASGGNQ